MRPRSGDPAPPPEGGQGDPPGLRRLRRQVLGAFAAFGAWWGGWGAVLPAVQQRAGVDDGGLGTALLFVAVGALASMRATGGLIDRFGRGVLPATMAAFAVAGLAPAAAAGTAGLAVAMLAVGAASGAMDVAINTAGTRYETAADSSLLNLAHAWFSLGVIGGGLATGVLRAAGAGAPLVLAALGVALLAVSATTVLFPTPQPRMDTGSAAPWRWWAPPKPIVVLGLLTALAFLVENAWQSWSALHLERTLAAGAAVSALGPATFGASAALGRLAGHRLSRTVAEHSLVRGGALLATVGTVIGATATDLPVAFLGIAAAGLGTAVCAPSLFSIAGRSVDDAQRGAVIGSVVTLAYLGFAISPAIVGLAARLTSLPIALASVATATAALALFAGRARPMH